MQENKNAEQQAELSIIGFYIEIAEKRVQEIQADIDNGTTTGRSIFNAQALICAWNKRLIELKRQRKEILWQTA